MEGTATTRANGIRNLIRAKLKEQSTSYRALAKQLGVSESTVKRWMTKDDWPLEALLSTFSRLGISWLDVQQYEDNFETRRDHLRADQETFVVQNPRESYVFLLLVTGHGFKQIAKKLNLSHPALEKMFLKLDKHHFVAYDGPKKIRILCTPPFRWTQSGKFSKRYFLPCARSLFTEILEANAGFTDRFDPQRALVNASEFILSDTSLARFKSDLYDLISKYRGRSVRDSTNRDPVSASPVGLLLAIDRFPLWERVMWEERN